MEWDDHLRTETIDEVDIARSRRRQKYGWTDVESAYDAYLLTCWQPRCHLDYALFTSRFPPWEVEGRAR